MMQKQRRFNYFILWLGVLYSTPLGQALSLTLGSATTAQARQAIVEDLLASPNPQEGVHAVMKTERVQAMGGAPQALGLSLASLGLPVPPEVRDLAAKAAGAKKVTPAEADKAAQMLNKMLEEQHVVLDHKVIDCRDKRRRAGEAIQDAAKAVRDLASETSAARSIIVEATSRIPQDRRSFEELKAEAQSSRVHCQEASQSDKVKAKSLERDAAAVTTVQKVLSQQCAGQAGFLQEPAADVVTDAERALQEVDRSLGSATVSLAQYVTAQEPSQAESTLHGATILHLHRKKALEAAGCPDVAAALGVVARKRGARASVGFLQEIQPVACQLTQQNCAAMLDIAAEVAGEIADGQARLRANAAQGRHACKDEVLYLKNQLSMEASQASDRTRELGEATWKAGSVGDLSNEKDYERQRLQAELRAITAKCSSEISGILYGKMCALQKVRDSLQVLAGRTELPEDCQVSDWEEGVCSASCGGGMKTLTRTVSLPPKGGAACPPLALNQRCGETACPADCKVSGWTGWSACSAQCDGGIQERNRVVTVKQDGNGVACPQLVDMRLCNSESCNSGCELLQWMPWTACSRACDGGTQTRSRGLRDEGKASCPATKSKERLEFQPCNENKCGHAKDIECAGAPMDALLLLDASGSMTKTGFATLKSLSLELVKRYSLSENGTKLSVVAFAKQATAISSLTDEARGLSSKLSSRLDWLQGPSNAGAGLTRAMSLLAAGGRQKATSLVLMITDGRIVDPFLARRAADKLKKSGIRLAFALVGTGYKNGDLLKSMASLPEKDNIIQLPDFASLPKFLDFSANRIVTGTCSAVSDLPN